LLANADWLRLFSEQAFTDAIAVPGDGRLRSRQTLLVAQGARLAAAEPSVPIVSVPSERNTWVVFGQGEPLAAELVARLRADGHRCLTVTPGERYIQLDADDVRVDPASPEDFHRVITQSLRETPAPAGVIFMWGLGGIGPQPSEAVEEALDVCVGGALYVAQALASGEGAASRLWFVTRGVAPIGDEAMAGSVVQAGLWGLARVLTNEHPELRCTAIDLSRQPTSAEIDSLLEELRVDDLEREIALRESARYVHRAGRIRCGDAGRGAARDPRARSASKCPGRGCSTASFCARAGGVNRVEEKWPSR
jgi:hypothetical protein